jgi:hypothetical protein
MDEYSESDSYLRELTFDLFGNEIINCSYDIIHMFYEGGLNIRDITSTEITQLILDSLIFPPPDEDHLSLDEDFSETDEEL